MTIEQTFTGAALIGIESDIPLDIATRAHNGTSFTPERRGQSEVSGWAEDMRNDYAHVMKYAKTDDERATMDAAFAEYRQALLTRKMGLLSSHCNIVSTMIAGPSNFPARMMNKRSEAYDRKVGEYLEFRQKALARMCNTFAEPTGIRTGEAGAVDALQAKIDKAEKLQAIMKETNAAIRKHKKAGPEAQVAAMVALGLTETQAYGLLKPDFCGRIGFPDYAMTNNNANLKRMKEQQAKAQKLAATATNEQEIGEVKIVDNAEADRLQMFFPVERVARPIYDLLKAHGFRWTPSVGCFQAYRGANASYWGPVIANEYNKQAA
jgi:hypothetical protein